MTEKLIMSHLQFLPERLKEEVLDFVLFLQKRSKEEKPVPKVERKFGSAPGKYKMADDFDAPLEDFKEYM